MRNSDSALVFHYAGSGDLEWTTINSAVLDSTLTWDSSTMAMAVDANDNIYVLAADSLGAGYVFVNLDSAGDLSATGWNRTASSIWSFTAGLGHTCQLLIDDANFLHYLIRANDNTVRYSMSKNASPTHTQLSGSTNWKQHNGGSPADGDESIGISGSAILFDAMLLNDGAGISAAATKIAVCWSQTGTDTKVAVRKKALNTTWALGASEVNADTGTNMGFPTMACRHEDDDVIILTYKFSLQWHMIKSEDGGATWGSRVNVSGTQAANSGGITYDGTNFWGSWEAPGPAPDEVHLFSIDPNIGAGAPSVTATWPQQQLGTVPANDVFAIHLRWARYHFNDRATVDVMITDSTDGADEHRVASGDSAPQASDNLTYNATSVKDCTWDGGSVNSTSINAGYTGTVTVTSTNPNLGDLSVASGTLNISSTTVTFNSFVLTGGTLNLSGGGVACAGDWDDTGGTTLGAATVTLTGATKTAQGLADYNMHVTGSYTSAGNIGATGTLSSEVRGTGSLVMAATHILKANIFSIKDTAAVTLRNATHELTNVLDIAAGASITLDAASGDVLFRLNGTQNTGSFLFANNAANKAVLYRDASNYVSFSGALPTFTGNVKFGNGSNFGIDINTVPYDLTTANDSGTITLEASNRFRALTISTNDTLDPLDGSTVLMNNNLSISGAKVAHGSASVTGDQWQWESSGSLTAPTATPFYAITVKAAATLTRGATGSFYTKFGTMLIEATGVFDLNGVSAGGLENDAIAKFDNQGTVQDTGGTGVFSVRFDSNYSLDGSKWGTFTASAVSWEVIGTGGTISLSAAWNPGTVGTINVLGVGGNPGNLDLAGFALTATSDDITIGNDGTMTTNGGDITAADMLIQSGGQLTGGSTLNFTTLTVSGTFDAATCDMNVTGTTTVNSGGSLIATNTTVSATWNLDGNVTINGGLDVSGTSGSGFLTIDMAGGTWDQSSATTLDMGADSSLEFNGGGAQTFTVSTGQTMNVVVTKVTSTAVSLSGTGTITFKALTTNASTTFDLSGMTLKLTDSAAPIINTGALGTTGLLHLAPTVNGQTISVASGTNFECDVLFDSNGANGNTFEFGSATYDGDVTVGDGSSLDVLAFHVITVTFRVTGLLTITAGATLNALGTPGTITLSSDVVNAGTWNSNSSSWAIALSGSWTGGGTSVNASNTTWTFSGTAENIDGDGFGAVVVNLGLTLSVDGGAVLGAESVTATGTVAAANNGASAALLKGVGAALCVWSGTAPSWTGGLLQFGEGAIDAGLDLATNSIVITSPGTSATLDLFGTNRMFTFTLTGGGSPDTIDLNDSTMKLNGNFTAPAGAVLVPGTSTIQAEASVNLSLAFQARQIYSLIVDTAVTLTLNGPTANNIMNAGSTLAVNGTGQLTLSGIALVHDSTVTVTINGTINTSTASEFVQYRTNVTVQGSGTHGNTVFGGFNTSTITLGAAYNATGFITIDQTDNADDTTVDTSGFAMTSSGDLTIKHSGGAPTGTVSLLVGSGTVTCAGLTVQNASVLNNGTGVVDVNGDLDFQTGSTYTPGTGELKSSGASAQLFDFAITSGSQFFHKLTINNATTFTVTGGDAKAELTNLAGNSLTVAASTIFTLGVPFVLRGTNGVPALANSGTINPGSGSLDFTVQGGQVITTSTLFGTLNVDVNFFVDGGTGTGTINLGATYTTTGNVTVTPLTANGIVNDTNGNDFTGGTITVVDAAGGTAELSVVAGDTATSNGNATFVNGRLTAGTNSILEMGSGIVGTATLSLGTNSSALQGLLVNGRTDLVGTQTVTIRGTGSVKVGSTVIFETDQDINVGAGSAIINPFDNLGTIRGTAGTESIIFQVTNSGPILFVGALSPGDMSAINVIMRNSVASNITTSLDIDDASTNALNFQDLTIENLSATADTFTVDLNNTGNNNTLDCRDLIITDMQGGSVTMAETSAVSRNWNTNTAGAVFTSQTVQLDGTGNVQTLSTQTFVDLEVAFAGQTTTLLTDIFVNTTCTVSGANGIIAGGGAFNIIITATSGTPWINSQATQTFNFGGVIWSPSATAVVGVGGFSSAMRMEADNAVGGVVFTHVADIVCKGGLGINGDCIVGNNNNNAILQLGSFDFNLQASGSLFVDVAVGQVLGPASLLADHTITIAGSLFVNGLMNITLPVSAFRLDMSVGAAFDVAGTGEFIFDIAAYTGVTAPTMSWNGGTISTNALVTVAGKSGTNLVITLNNTWVINQPDRFLWSFSTVTVVGSNPGVRINQGQLANTPTVVFQFASVTMSATPPTVSLQFDTAPWTGMATNDYFTLSTFDQVRFNIDSQINMDQCTISEAMIDGAATTAWLIGEGTVADSDRLDFWGTVPDMAANVIGVHIQKDVFQHHSILGGAFQVSGVQNSIGVTTAFQVDGWNVDTTLDTGDLVSTCTLTIQAAGGITIDPTIVNPANSFGFLNASSGSFTYSPTAAQETTLTFYNDVLVTGALTIDSQLTHNPGTTGLIIEMSRNVGLNCTAGTVIIQGNSQTDVVRLRGVASLADTVFPDVVFSGGTGHILKWLDISRMGGPSNLAAVKWTTATSSGTMSNCRFSVNGAGNAWLWVDTAITWSLSTIELQNNISNPPLYGLRIADAAPDLKVEKMRIGGGTLGGVHINSAFAGKLRNIHTGDGVITGLSANGGTFATGAIHDCVFESTTDHVSVAASTQVPMTDCTFNTAKVIGAGHLTSWGHNKTNATKVFVYGDLTVDCSYQSPIHQDSFSWDGWRPNTTGTHFELPPGGTTAKSDLVPVDPTTVYFLTFTGTIASLTVKEINGLGVESILASGLTASAAALPATASDTAFLRFEFTGVATETLTDLELRVGTASGQLVFNEDFKNHYLPPNTDWVYGNAGNFVLFQPATATDLMRFGHASGYETLSLSMEFDAIGGSERAGWVLGWKDSNNYYEVVIEPGAPNRVVIRKFVAGIPTVVDQAQISASLASTIVFRVDRNVSTFRGFDVFINGSQITGGGPGVDQWDTSATNAVVDITHDKGLIGYISEGVQIDNMLAKHQGFFLRDAILEFAASTELTITTGGGCAAHLPNGVFDAQDVTVNATRAVLVEDGGLIIENNVTWLDDSFDPNIDGIVVVTCANLTVTGDIIVGPAGQLNIRGSTIRHATEGQTFRILTETSNQVPPVKSVKVRMIGIIPRIRPVDGTGAPYELDPTFEVINDGPEPEHPLTVISQEVYGRQSNRNVVKTHGDRTFTLSFTTIGDMCLYGTLQQHMDDETQLEVAYQNGITWGVKCVELTPGRQRPSNPDIVEFFATFQEFL
jgi:hypothetical protein